MVEGFKAFQDALAIIKGSKVFSAIGGALKGLVTGPFAAVAVGIGILIAAFVNLWKNNEDFRNKIIEIWNRVKDAFKDFHTAITDRINDLGLDFSSFTELAKAVWKDFTEFIAPVFIAAFEIVACASILRLLPFGFLLTK